MGLSKGRENIWNLKIKKTLRAWEGGSAKRKVSKDGEKKSHLEWFWLTHEGWCCKLGDVGGERMGRAEQKALKT